MNSSYFKYSRISVRRGIFKLIEKYATAARYCNLMRLKILKC